MKKRLSVFWATILIILPLVILADVFVLFAAYKHISENTYEHYIYDLQNVSMLADKTLGDRSLHDKENAEVESTVYKTLCEYLDVTYIYSLEVDTEQNTVKYLAIGTGKDASQKFISERPIGYVVQNAVDEHILAALNGDNVNAVDHISNRFDDTIILYLKRSSEKYPNEIIAAEVSVSDVMSDMSRDFNYTALLTVFFSALVVMIFAVIIRRLVSHPAQTVSQKMSSFVHERKSGFKPLKITGSREFADIAGSFNLMAEEIDRYLSELNELNRQNAELSIARDIQMGLLEPTGFENETASVKAYMLPAKLVGGDLYDWQVLSDGKICVIIADVSGKGISAALFMSRAVTLLHQYAESGMSPGKILYEYNNHLAAHNPNMLFITTFVAIYDPVTGMLRYSNAGHNYPYIVSDRLTVLNGKQGMAAGIFENQSYPEHVAALKPGDLLFLYTDGVTEAKSVNNRLFGEEALEAVLNGLTGQTNADAVSAVLSSLEEHAKGAEQSDDITMLTLRIPEMRRVELRLEAKPERLAELSEAIVRLDLPKNTEAYLRLIAEEMFVNICSYAYPGGSGTADVTIEYNARKVTLTFADSGVPFDPTSDVIKIEDYDIDNAVGGLGRYLTFSLADDYSYERRDGKNILRITKAYEDDKS